MIQKGDTFEKSYTLTKEIYEGFIRTFDDRNPLHTQKDFAIAAGFSEKVMHGNILNGFLSHFVGETLPTQNVIIHSQSILFKAPVYLGECLTLKATVVNFSEAVNTAEFKYHFLGEDGKTKAKGRLQIGLLK